MKHTFVGQLGKLIRIVMVIHVRKVAVGFRRTRLEYGLVIWCVFALKRLERCYRMPVMNCKRAMKCRGELRLRWRKVVFDRMQARLRRVLLMLGRSIGIRKCIPRKLDRPWEKPKP